MEITCLKHDFYTRRPARAQPGSSVLKVDKVQGFDSHSAEHTHPKA